MALTTSAQVRRTTSEAPTAGAFGSAGRHVRGREPNFFELGPSLCGGPFDDVGVVLFENDWSVRFAYRVSLDAAMDHHKQPGVQGCRLMIRGDDSWQSDPRVERLA